MQRFPGAALLAVRLYTGRTHQIRVHFYDQGMPLLGDPVYQLRRNRKRVSLAPRQMLHSWRLAFRHPYSGKRIALEAPMPETFTAVMEKIGRLTWPRPRPPECTLLNIYSTRPWSGGFPGGRCFSAHINSKKSKCDYHLTVPWTPGKQPPLEEDVNGVIQADLAVIIEDMEKRRGLEHL